MVDFDLADYYADRYTNKDERISFDDIRRGKMIQRWVGNGKKILDVGAGRNYIQRFYQKGNVLHVVDLDKKILTDLKNKGIKTHSFDLAKEPWPIKDESFDVVVAGEIIEHLFFPSTLVQESHRVLKPGGIFIGSTPNAFNWRRRLEFLLGVQINSPIDGEHIRFFNKSYLEKLLQENFRSVNVDSYTPIKFCRGLFASSFVWKCVK